MSEVAELLAGAASRLGPAHVAERWDALPDPVRRYLRAAIPDSTAAPPVASVHVIHGGAFRTSPGGRWLPIEGEEYHSVAEPGFVWTARFSPLPLVKLTVTDSFIHGRGRGKAEAMGRLPVSTLTGPETDQSAAARWLMEAVWFPYAFVGPNVAWEPVDAASARVRLTNIADVVVTMHFDRTTDLPARVEGDRHMNRTRRPFRGSCAAFQRHNGVMVPTVLEGSWILPEGEFAYVDFHVRTIEYNPEL